MLCTTVWTCETIWHSSLLEIWCFSFYPLLLEVKHCLIRTINPWTEAQVILETPPIMCSIWTSVQFQLHSSCTTLGTVCAYITWSIPEQRWNVTLGRKIQPNSVNCKLNLFWVICTVKLCLMGQKVLINRLHQND